MRELQIELVGTFRIVCQHCKLIDDIPNVTKSEALANFESYGWKYLIHYMGTGIGGGATFCPTCAKKDLRELFQDPFESFLTKTPQGS